MQPVGVAQQVHNERMANGGRLTQQEKRRPTPGKQEQPQIYNEKHNGNTAKGAPPRGHER